MNDLFSNIGGKIKAIAIGETVIGAIASVIAGFAMMATDVELFFAGLVVMVVGSLVAWISSFLLYAFGEIVDQLVEINGKLNAGGEKSPEPMGVANLPPVKSYSSVNIQQTKPVQKTPTGWTCKKCGTTNQNGSICCKDCGSYK